MQTFICPICGQGSTFDPWVESALCPNCGYTPAAAGTTGEPQRVASKPDLNRLPSRLDGLADPTRIPGDPVTRLYNFSKEMVPNYIMLVRVDDHLYTFGDDARTVIAVCGTDLRVDEAFTGVKPPTARMPFDERERYMNQVKEAGHRIGMAKNGILTCAQCGHKNRTKDIFFPSYECAQCGYVPPQRDKLIESFIKAGIEATRAGNLQKAQAALKTALEHGGSPDHQAGALLWLAEATPNLGAKQHYLEQALSLSPGEATATLARRKLAQVEEILEAQGMKRPPIELPPDTGPTHGPRPVAAERFVCPHCGGGMRYGPDGGGLSCQHCGHRQPVTGAQDEGDGVAERPFLAAMAALKGHAKPVETRTFECAACGASFVLAPEKMSLTCPYCAATYAVEKAALKPLIPPHGLIPFTVSEPEAEQALGRWLEALPSPETALSPAGLYLPVWTFDLEGIINWSCEVRVGWSLARLSAYDWRRGTRRVSYDDILIPGSWRLAAALVEELIDFDLGQLVPYDARYLADWPARVYDVAMSDAAIQARGEVVRRFEALLAEEHGQIKDVRLDTAGLQVETFKLILLPVWIAHYTREGRRRHILINGQTGTVRGQRPESRG
jgi:DNA-directed RNA polymerase subunit RPC12/RpoP